MSAAGEREYPEEVYVSCWDDMERLCEDWRAQHGVDAAFCVETLRQFAHHLENDKP